MGRPPSAVESLRIENMVIYVPGAANLYFKRLKYKYCPPLKKGTFGKVPPTFSQEVELIDAGRDDFIRLCYQLLGDINTRSAATLFYRLIKYLVWIDNEKQFIPEKEYLAWTHIDAYMNWCAQQSKLGQMTLYDFTDRKKLISFFLRQLNRCDEAKRLPSIKGLKEHCAKRKTIDLESELKPTAKALFKAYFALLEHFKNGSTPKKHPLYDKDVIEQYARKKGISSKKLGGKKVAFTHSINTSHPYKPIIELAMMLTLMLTGMNTKPLADMRISDTSYREVQGGKYIFDSVKGRASHQEQDNTIGFSKHAKRFIDSWLEVSKEIANGDESSYLFPYINLDGSVISYSQTGMKPQLAINKLLDHLGLAKINASKFRKTKSDALYRVTESVYLVAMSNNNSMEVTARTYIHGTDKEHENNLSAAMDAKFEIANGKEVKAAIVEAKFKHGDILDDYEYQRIRKGQDRTHEARTPTGARCNDNRLGAASIIENSLKRAEINTETSEIACTDFLACFDCAQHAFVTDVEDIWLMLSFKETLQQLQQTPAINSMPERKYTDLFNTVDSALNGFRVKNETNYNLALEKLKNAPHPLYATVYSLNDLLDTFR